MIPFMNLTKMESTNSLYHSAPAPNGWFNTKVATTIKN